MFLTIINVAVFIANLSFFVFTHKRGIRSLMEIAGVTFYMTGWKYAIKIAVFLLKLKLQQWWGKNIEKIEPGKYILSHVINDQEVKVIVNSVSGKDQPFKIFTEDKRDITEYARPFFRIKPEEVSPAFFFEDSLIVSDIEGNEYSLENRNDKDL